MMLSLKVGALLPLPICFLVCKFGLRQNLGGLAFLFSFSFSCH
jgi:hypothetical protein